MKRIFAVFLAFVFLFSLCACAADTSEKPTEVQNVPETGESSSLSTEELLAAAPDTYDFALQVSINPEFILYLVEGRVVAYQALNEDAQKVDEGAAIEGRTLQEVLIDIVRFSYECGFLKDGGDVTVTMVSAFRSETEANELLTEAENTVVDTAKNCGISVNPVITVENSVEFPTNPPEQESNPEPESNPSAPNQDGGDTQPDDNEHHESRDPTEGCSVCQGSGICTRCDGSGTMICEECDSGYETCSKCGGEGYAGFDENGPKVCDQCGGNGYLAHGNCSGTGFVSCPGCHGSGNCEACNGTGRKPND